jgi:hypothetical protein
VATGDNDGSGIEKAARHQTGRARLELTEDEGELEEPEKVFAADRRSNEEAELAARAARDPEWRKGGGGGGRGAAAAVLPGDAATATGLLAYGPPPPNVARGLRVLKDPAPWVRLSGD